MSAAAGESDVPLPAAFGEPQYGDSVAQAFWDEGLDGLWTLLPAGAKAPLPHR